MPLTERPRPAPHELEDADLEDSTIIFSNSNTASPSRLYTPLTPAPKGAVDDNTIFPHKYVPVPLSLPDERDRDSPPTLRRRDTGVLSVTSEHFGSAGEIFRDFCAWTSAHGVPHIGRVSTMHGRLFWVLAFTLCSCAFSYQTYWTIAKYLRFDKIVEMELFAYKFHKTATAGGGLGASERFITLNKTAAAAIDAEFGSGGGWMNDAPESAQLRAKRHASYQPLKVDCECRHPQRRNCSPNRDPNPNERLDICICFDDIISGFKWPCYSHSIWFYANCSRCGLSRTCPMDVKDYEDYYPSQYLIVNSQQNITRKKLPKPPPHLHAAPCICENITKYCVQWDKSFDDIQWWRPFTFETRIPASTTVVPSSTTTRAPNVEIVKQMGIENITDEVALTNKANENVMFIMNGINPKQRRGYSYGKEELITQCSFDQDQCDISKVFMLHVDPIFGNCYTFNSDHTVKLWNTRAGPMYGLRLLVNVNQTDYMPTTEATGVRITVHDQRQNPFPDTFGYSAPTGFVSSFGLKLKQLQHLPAPYGTCLPTAVNDAETFTKIYSTEGCHRTCFQRRMLDKCGCGDPHFPIPSGESICPAANVTARNCLKTVLSSDADWYKISKWCTSCIQPCTEYMYETSYSASKWPSDSYQVRDCPYLQGDAENNTLCIEYYRKHTAFLEIYYEQLNYESLREVEAYSMVNLLSDFGGNIGLWIGFSAITVIEFCTLAASLFVYGVQERQRRNRRRRRRKRKLQQQALLLNPKNEINANTYLSTAAPGTTASTV